MINNRKLKRFLHIVLFLLIISIGANIYQTQNKEYVFREKEVFDTCFNYPENISSIDFPASYLPEYPMYNAYAITGEELKFASIRLKGTISNSLSAKYDREFSIKIIRNIQYIIYFFTDYNLRFRENDRISFFYRPSDKKIVYLRYNSRRLRSIFDAFLFSINGKEKYVHADGLYLVPCFKNGPFRGCPEMILRNYKHALRPLFLLDQHSPVYMPFEGKIKSIDYSTRRGGSIDVSYSKYKLNAYIGNLGEINNSLKKNKIYDSDMTIGYSGFNKISNRDGIIYYLRKSEHKIVSPFIFHHVEKRGIDSDYLENFNLTVGFYHRWYRRARRFESKYYVY